MSRYPARIVSLVTLYHIIDATPAPSIKVVLHQETYTSTAVAYIRCKREVSNDILHIPMDTLYVWKGNRVTSLLFITAYLRFSLTIQHFIMMCYSTSKISNLM